MWSEGPATPHTSSTAPPQRLPVAGRSSALGARPTSGLLFSRYAIRASNPTRTPETRGAVRLEPEVVVVQPKTPHLPDETREDAQP